MGVSNISFCTGQWCLKTLTGGTILEVRNIESKTSALLVLGSEYILNRCPREGAKLWQASTDLAAFGRVRGHAKLPGGTHVKSRVPK